MKIDKILKLAFVIAVVSLLVFTAVMFIYKSYNKSAEKKIMLSAIEKIENDLMILKFHGSYDGDSINDYTRIMWGLDYKVVALEEYSIYDLDRVPVYEVLFEEKKESPSLDDPEYKRTFWTGKYREPGGKWIYFASPDFIRQEFRFLLSN